MQKQLQTHFGFSSFKQGQKEVIEKIMNGESAAAIFPTGAGKSICYQLPAVLLQGLTLVVSPLLSLMKDQLDFLLKHNISAARLDSTLGRDEYNEILRKSINGELKILMISVERFKNERFRYNLEKMKISLLVIDEAHCISEWGHNFRPDYIKLPDYREEFGINQVLLLTATATKQVVEDMSLKLNVSIKNFTITGAYRKNLFLQVSPVIQSEKNNFLLKRIKKFPEEPTIVYVTLQKTSENISNFLCRNGINAHHYHAGMKNEDRDNIQNRFMDGSLDCIVATIAFGMGIDKKNIRRVIHYDLPKSIESYSQEIGRSGRDGNNSLCEVLANKDSINILENFIYGDTPEKKSIFKLLSQLKKNNGFVWEIKPVSLSNELNIRLLPLKTLLVYLDIEGILKPKYTFFSEYSFKYNISSMEIIKNFEGERENFVKTILDNCSTKKTWTYVDILDIQSRYNTDRKRIITALEYFDGQGWIELQSKQAIEVYHIVTQAFDIKNVTDKIFDLFKLREKQGIRKIHEMISFFESDSCISKRLSEYFGEYLEKENCGHCSFCKSGKAVMENAAKLTSLTGFDFNKITSEFKKIIGDDYSLLNITKFLCGIRTPLFSKLKVKKLSSFGVFEQYPFMDVQNWIEKNE
ncbi:MAG: RecQ family ATP-dependent DNA helicase [Spirochaetales bacterium]|nr:RecQ family ATP-dependent DNA helicase [Spirochaetales bacterium]